MSEPLAPEVAAKQALFDLLTAHFAALDVAADAKDKVLVSYGPPPQDAFQRRHVWIGGHETDDDWGAVGAQAIDSTLDVNLVVDVMRKTLGANPARTVDQEAADVANQIRLAVRNAVRDRTQIGGGSGIQWAGSKRSTSPDGPLPTEDGAYVVTLLQTVQFRVRIR